MSLGQDSENWRVITGFPNYQVSDLGRVRSTRTWRILKPARIGRGYLAVSLRNMEIVKHVEFTN